MLVELEAVLNFRLLTAQSSDQKDGEALTPGHFLIGEPLRALPVDLNPDIASGCLRQWRHVSSLWSTDYLRQLQQRNKCCRELPNLGVGELVLVHEDGIGPQQWLLARVIKVVERQDRKV